MTTMAEALATRGLVPADLPLAGMLAPRAALGASAAPLRRTRDETLSHGYWNATCPCGVVIPRHRTACGACPRGAGLTARPERITR